MNVIYSTATTDIGITAYGDTPKNGVPTVKRKVTIRGGANVARPRTFETARGIATILSDEDFVFVTTNPAFERMRKRGFFTIGKDERGAERAAKDMTPGDKSAPKTEATMQEELRKQGVRGRDGKPGEITTGAPNQGD